MHLFDLHSDTATVCFDNSASLYNNCYAVDINRLKNFKRAVLFFAVFTDDSQGQDVNRVFEVIEYIKKFQDSSFSVATNPSKIIDTKVYGLISIENASFIGSDLSVIDRLKSSGVKMLSLTWNGKNHLASGKDDVGGITEIGKAVIERCEQNNIIIDVSHLNDQSFFDVCNVSKKPIIASHSNARKVCDNKRNLTDEQIRAVISKGGLVGLNLFPRFVNNSARLNFEDICLHIDHFIKLSGQKHIALGCDFDGCKMDEKLKSVADLKSLYYYIKDRMGLTLADDIFYNNAYNFFKNME